MTKKRSQEFINGEMTWKLLENILKHYYEFRELFEREGIDELALDNGYTINLFDILSGIEGLPRRQRQAVQLVCIEGLREVDAAREMGFERWSSQVGTYKRLGLQKLINNFWPPEGEL